MKPISLIVAPNQTNESKNLEVGRKRFQRTISPLSPELSIDGRGRIQDISLPALRLLGYHAHRPIDNSFFSLVHRKNLPNIIRDVDAMAHRGKTRASWLLRIRTGKHRWQWYRAAVSCTQTETGRAIKITLRDLYER